MNENIVIAVTDRIASTIPTKFRDIAQRADEAATHVDRLTRILASIQTPPALAVINTHIGMLNRNISSINTSSASAVAAFAQMQAAMNTAASTAASLAAQQNNSAIGAQRLAAATAQAARAQTQATSAQQAAANQLSVGLSQVTVAQNQAAASAQNLISAQNQAALSTLQLQQAQVQAQSSASSLSQRLNLLKGAILGIGSAIGIGAFAKMTSTMTDLKSRVAGVTGSVAGQVEAFKQLQQIAQDTYSSFELTAESFLGNAANLNALGYSTNQVLSYTAALNDAMIVSGAKGETAAQVQTALTKAMALGALKGEELNTIVAKGGEVATLLADALGVNVLDLKAVGTQGKITSKIIADTLIKSQEALRAKSDEMSTTILDAMQRVKNSFVAAINYFDELTGTSDLLASGLDWVSQNMKILGVVAAGVGAGLLLAFGSKLVGVLKIATLAVRTFTLALLANPLVLLVAALAAAGAALWAFGDDVIAIAGTAVTLKDIFIAAFTIIGAQLVIFKDYFKDLFREALAWVSSKIPDLGLDFDFTFENIVKIAKSGVNSIIAIISAAVDIASLLFEKWPVAFKLVWHGIKVAAVGALNWIIGIYLKGLSKLTDVVAKVNEKAAAKLRAGIESMRIKIPTPVAPDGVKELGDEMAKILKDSMDTDYLEGFSKEVVELAKKQRAEKDAIVAAGKAENDVTSIGIPLLEKVIKEKKKGKEAREKELVTLKDILNELENESKLLKLNARDRDIERKIQDAQQRMTEKMTSAEYDILKERLKLLQLETDMVAAKDNILAGTVDKRREELDHMRALRALESEGLITKGDVSTDIMGSSVGGLFKGTGVEEQSRAAKYAEDNALIEELLAQNLITETDFANARRNLWVGEHHAKAETYKGYFDTIIATNTDANGEMNAIAKAAAVANAIINTYTAATGAYASLAPIPYVGPALGAAAAGAAVAAGMANVAKIREQGFMSGGYTGNMSRSAVAGVVHGQEFVMNAEATNRIGVSNLQALQSGQAFVPGAAPAENDTSGERAGQSPTFNIIIVDTQDEAQSAANELPGDNYVIDAIRRNRRAIKQELE